jgi:hypothetical protein
VQARVVRLAHADPYVFRSHEADVLREMNKFIPGLRKNSAPMEGLFFKGLGLCPLKREVTGVSFGALIRIGYPATSSADRRSKHCRMSTTPEDARRAMALLEVLAYLKHL